MKKGILLTALFISLGISFATATLLEEISVLSTQILGQSKDRATDLQTLKQIFTSCAEKNTNEKIKETCKEFLDTTFPALEKKYYQPTSWTWSTPYPTSLEKRISFKALPNATGTLQIDWGDGII
jgi:hypothetical protein